MYVHVGEVGKVVVLMGFIVLAQVSMLVSCV